MKKKEGTKRNKVVVVGAGSFGTALATTLNDQGHHVTLLARDSTIVEAINTHHENPRYLRGVTLPDSLCAKSYDEGIGDDDHVIVLAVPTHAMRQTCQWIAPMLTSSTMLLHVTKGFEEATGYRMSQVIEEECPFVPRENLVVVSGPSHAEELSRRMPTTLVAASRSKKTAEFVQDLFMHRYLRVYTNPDVIGTEVGGSLKNIIALGCGISDGLQYGDNAKAALMTRGLVEITRLGVALGADYNTFSGLTGTGDLIVTCTSKHSRNWQAGYLLGQGLSLDEALRQVGMVVEGVKTTPTALRLAEQHRVHLPIAAAINAVLFQQKSPKEAVADLMLRSKKHEVEEYVHESSASWQYP